MSEIYKGHRIITIVTSPYGEGKVTHVVYRVDRRDGDHWKLAREGKLYGPFDSLEGARTSAESVARGWIDQQGKEGESPSSFSIERRSPMTFTYINQLAAQAGLRVEAVPRGDDDFEQMYRLLTDRGEPLTPGRPMTLMEVYQECMARTS